MSFTVEPSQGPSTATDNRSRQHSFDMSASLAGGSPEPLAFPVRRTGSTTMRGRLTRSGDG